MKNLKSQNNQERHSAIIARQQIVRSGPLPTPEEFSGYENVLKGSAERILKMAENHSAVVVSEIETSSKRDFIITIIVISGTFLFAFSGLAIGVYLLIAGKIGVAIGTMFTSVVFLLITLLRSFFKNPEK